MSSGIGPKGTISWDCRREKPLELLQHHHMGLLDNRLFWGRCGVVVWDCSEPFLRSLQHHRFGLKEHRFQVAAASSLGPPAHHYRLGSRQLDGKIVFVAAPHIFFVRRRQKSGRLPVFLLILFLTNKVVAGVLFILSLRRSCEYRSK